LVLTVENDLDSWPMPQKATARWVPRKSKGWPLKKGKLVAAEGKVVANGITLAQAKAMFPEYKIVVEGRKRDPLDYRLPGSYGSRQ